MRYLAPNLICLLHAVLYKHRCTNLYILKECHLSYAHYDGFINDEEFILLYDLNTAKSPDLPYWNYTEFDLDKLCDDECKTEFRFFKNDIYNLIDVMTLPDEIKCYNGLKATRSKLCAYF